MIVSGEIKSFVKNDCETVTNLLSSCSLALIFQNSITGERRVKYGNKSSIISFGIVLLVYVGAEAIKNILFVGNLKAQEISVYGFLRGSGYVRNGWIILGEGLLFLLIQLVLVEKQVRTYEIY